MTEEFGIKLTVDTSSIDKKLNGTANKFKDFNDKVIKSMGDNFKKAGDKIKDTFDNIADSAIGKKVGETFTKSFGVINRGIQFIGKAFKVLKIATAGIIIGVLVGLGLIAAKLISLAKQSEQVQYAMQGFKAMMQAISDTIGKNLGDALIRVIKYLNVFLKALTGVDFLAKAVKKATDSMNKSLSSLDEIENIDDNGGKQNWWEAFDKIELNPDTVKRMERLGKAVRTAWEYVNKLWSDFVGLDEDIKKMILAGGLGMLFGLISNDFVIAFGGISLIIWGFNDLLNGDFSSSVEGAIKILGGAGLLGALSGTVSGVGAMIGFAGLIEVIWGFADLLNGDANDAVKGFIKILVGTGGILAAIALVNSKFLILNARTILVVVAIVAVTAGVIAMIKAWDNMDSLHRVIAILGAVGAAVIALAVAVGALQSAWSLGAAAVAIVAGIGAIAYAISDSVNNTKIDTSGMTSQLDDYFSSSIKKYTDNVQLPSYDVGSNYVPNDQIAQIHKGEAIVPAKFNNRKFFGSGNEETNELLRQLIDISGDKEDIIFNVDSRELARATYEANEVEKERRNTSTFVKVV